jgi:Homeodomain-like domain
MGCAKSWLYKWKNRYQATEATWFQEHARRPETTPSKTPEAIEAEIIFLRQTLSRDGAKPVSARVIQDHLSHHPIASIPSRRTIYRIFNRQTKKGASPSMKS